MRTLIGYSDTMRPFLLVVLQFEFIAEFNPEFITELLLEFVNFSVKFKFSKHLVATKATQVP